MSAVTSLRLPESELRVFKDYAKINNMTLSEMIRVVVMEKIENEYDLKIFDEYEYEKEKESGTLKTYSHSEVWKELDV